ncbi:MAG: UDP-N-acetylglucosamine 1-carboxyvinyltransferase [Anaeroplasmataceae bacterium]|nr:UDP-N-acetylglucosamine 1-carboxyvinyltransferase [Anaeroplasmataceae bacterium]
MNVKVTGGGMIKGNVSCSGAKNASIPLLCASLLAKGKVLLRNVPRISDVFDICGILKRLDCKVVFKGHTMLIDNTNLKYRPLLFEECQRIRGSYYLIGVFLTLFSKCEILLPGGCKIGARPIDIHLEAFSDLGYEYQITDNVLWVYKKKAVKEANIVLKNKSVGASINACFAGLSLNHFVMHNILFEPEGKDVLDFLNKLGYPVVLNDDNIAYTKKNLEFKLTKHTIVSDRIEAITYMVLGLLAGDITIKKIETKNLETPLKILKDAGYNVLYNDSEIHAKKSIGAPMEVKTEVYPGFPTDAQSMFGVLFARTTGKSSMQEAIFENRMHIYYDLLDSGVECLIKNNKAIVEGTKTIYLKNYKAYDLRHGAALLLLALSNEGEALISNFDYVLRGYDDFINKIRALGGKIEII